jgi:hypothetical protein
VPSFVGVAVNVAEPLEHIDVGDADIDNVGVNIGFTVITIAVDATAVVGAHNALLNISTV